MITAVSSFVQLPCHVKKKTFPLESSALLAFTINPSAPSLSAMIAESWKRKL